MHLELFRFILLFTILFLELFNLQGQLVDLNQMLLLQLEGLVSQLLELRVLLPDDLVLLYIDILLELEHVTHYSDVFQIRLLVLFRLDNLVGQKCFHVL